MFAVHASKNLYVILLQEEGVAIREAVGIKEVQPGRLLLQDGSTEEFDECLWCTQAGAPPWLKTTGLQLGTLAYVCEVREMRFW